MKTLVGLGSMVVVVVVVVVMLVDGADCIRLYVSASCSLAKCRAGVPSILPAARELAW